MRTCAPLGSLIVALEGQATHGASDLRTLDSIEMSLWDAYATDRAALRDIDLALDFGHGQLRFAMLSQEGSSSSSAHSAGAAGDSTDSAALAQKLNNPVASMISVPFQVNYDHGFDPDGDGWRITLNIQPVIPFNLNDDWNLISRTILPVIYQDDVGQVGSDFGLGDITQSLFLSPAKPGKWIWGVGPAFLIPTATDDVLGTEKFGIGPTALILQQNHGWTYGALVNHIWSVAGDDDRDDVSATFLQPFLSYTTPKATTFGINTESTYDWEHYQWTVPINLFVSQLVKFGPQPVSFTAGVRYYVESPDGGPEWGLRFVVTFLFPE
jgi:hypothetical protein